MIFRKKNKTKGIEIEFDDDRRNYFRITPPLHKPVSVRIGGHNFNVVDISAGGLAFQSKPLPVGKTVKTLVVMTGDDTPVPVIMETLSQIKPGVSRAVFKKIREEDRERIHQYVLDVQKEEMARKRKEAKEMDNKLRK